MTFAQLKIAYKQAVDDGVMVFRFQDQDVLTTYAKYLIEYLESDGKLR